MIYDTIIPTPDTVKVRGYMKSYAFRWKRIVFESLYFIKDAFLNISRLCSDKLLGLRFKFNRIHPACTLYTQFLPVILEADTLGFF
jgi:hypothetical protein